MSRSRTQHGEGPSDADLVEVCNAGNANQRHVAFAEIYNRHQSELLAFTRGFSPDQDVAEDVVQDTFEYLLHRFPPEGKGVHLTAQLTSLLHTVAMHKAVSASRRAHRWASSDVDPDDLPAPETPTPCPIRAVLAILPATQRETFRLRVVEDYTLREVAEVLHVPVGTVKSRLTIAVRHLRHSQRAYNLLH